MRRTMPNAAVMLALLALLPAGCGQPATDTTASPGTSASAAATETARANPAPGRRPEAMVAITEDHRLVVLDRYGEEQRVLATGDDPAAFGGESQEPVAAGAFLDSVAMDQASGRVYYSVCCEPAPGNLYRVPLDGGEPEHIGVGYDPAVSPVDGSVAVVEMQWLTLISPDGERLVVRSLQGSADMPSAIAAPAWSPDGRTLAFARVDGERSTVHVIAAEATGMDEARAVPAEGANWHQPLFDADGRLVVIEQETGADGAPTGSASRLVVDANTGDVLERTPLGQPVRRQRFDGTGRNLLTVYLDGTLEWSDAQRQMLGALGGRFQAAAW